MSGAAVVAAERFIDALDRNDVDELLPLCDPNGSWWVDTGLDRAAGVQGVDPGQDRPWPLHGTMPLGEKLELLRGLRTRFPDGCRQRRWHSFGDDRRAVVEVEGDGVFANGGRYANRYAFAIETRDGLVVRVHEYLDTAHAADVFSGRHLDRRTTATEPTPVVVEADPPGAQIGLDFVGAISAASPDRLAAITRPDAIWWADSGPNREPGRFDAEPRGGDRVPLWGQAVLADRAKHLPGLIATFEGGWALHPQWITAGDTSVAVEAASHGVRGDGSTYQNRYCFVLDLVEGQVAAVREYCDTLHAFDFFNTRPRPTG
ncbi:MAG: nuclear transport factor 2 family protein [Ilumatobacteraceae bacterium]|nr:nuclear transport factor 2 family protein [Ilumatobacteraceae bacterium]